MPKKSLKSTAFGKALTKPSTASCAAIRSVKAASTPRNFFPNKSSSAIGIINALNGDPHGHQKKVTSKKKVAAKKAVAKKATKSKTIKKLKKAPLKKKVVAKKAPSKKKTAVKKVAKRKVAKKTAKRKVARSRRAGAVDPSFGMVQQGARGTTFVRNEDGSVTYQDRDGEAYKYDANGKKIFLGGSAR